MTRLDSMARSKLTNLDVALMRQLRTIGYSNGDIARVYGIHPSYVSRLVRGVRRPTEAKRRGFLR